MFCPKLLRFGKVQNTESMVMLYEDFVFDLGKKKLQRQYWNKHSDL